MAKHQIFRANRLKTGAAAVVLVGALFAATAPAIAASRAPRTDSYNFNAPIAAVAMGGNLYVANSAGNSVTEANASTGAFVSYISGAKYGFNDPTAIVAVGSHIFVANGGGDSITEFMATTGVVNRKILGFSDPIALISSGSHLFVLNATGSVDKVITATGKMDGKSSGVAYGFDSPASITASDHHLFVTNGAGNSVTEVLIATMGFVALLQGASYGFSDPAGITSTGDDVWVANETGGSVTELSGVTGAADQDIVNGNLPTPGPITYGDGYVFAASPPGSSPMVTQVTESTGAVNWMMCNTNGPYLFNNPESLVVAGEDLWVVNEGGNSLTEMDDDSGALLGTFS